MAKNSVFTESDYREMRNFLESDLFATMTQRLFQKYERDFRTTREIDQRIEISARLDAVEDLIASMQGVLDDLEVDSPWTEI